MLQELHEGIGTRPQLQLGASSTLLLHNVLDLEELDKPRQHCFFIVRDLQSIQRLLSTAQHGLDLNL